MAGEAGRLAQCFPEAVRTGRALELRARGIPQRVPKGAHPKFRKTPVASIIRKTPVASINSVGEGGDETRLALSSAEPVGAAGCRSAAVLSLRIDPHPSPTCEFVRNEVHQ
jgi:hypothetical protein